jgi:LuxR family quorum-sensing system transcriptional regulator CciR
MNMGLFSDLQEYLEVARRTRTSDDLKSATAAFVCVLGFDYFGLLHHVDFLKPPESAIRIGNYPSAWREIMEERQYFGDDPILTACQKTVSGFQWRNVASLVEMTPRQREIRGAGAEAGLGDGYTVPLHLPGDFEASCSFGLIGSRPAPIETFPAAQYVACFAFEQARRLMSLERTQGRAPRLTQRQLDCLVLSARGKSASVAAELLGISSDTVYEHLAEAKRRYGVATIQQLTVRALHDSQIAFADLL